MNHDVDHIEYCHDYFDDRGFEILGDDDGDHVADDHGNDAYDCGKMLRAKMIMKMVGPEMIR